MDSAGTGSSEVRIKQLQTAIANMHTEMQTLKNKYDAFEGQTSHNIQIYGQTIHELRGTVQTLSDRIVHLENQVSVPPATVPAVTPKLPPFRFGGDRDKFRGFLNQCRLYFDANPTQFPTDRSKVLCIIMLLTHKAIAWASPLIETQDARLNNFEDFIDAMSQMFDDPNRGATAEAALLALRQGRRPVTEYAMEFKRWAVDTDWNDAAKMSFFRKGLCSALKDELARAEAPSGLDAFINHCIRIDTRLSERRQEKWATLNYDTKQSLSFPGSTPKEPQGKINRESGSEPMQVDSILKRENVDRREHRLRESLCFYCGKSDHFLINCPRRPRRLVAAITDPDFSDGESIASETELSEKAIIHSIASVAPHIKKENKGSHCFLPIKFLINSQWISTSAMVDSGASGNFMDLSFAQRHGVKFQKKLSPVIMETVDGSPLSSGPVDQETEPLEIIITPQHHEVLSFLLISSPHFPVILGLPWLQAQNPVINWETKEINFPATDVPSTAPSEQVSEDPAQDNKVIELPSVYKEFADVCDKQNADKLPPHRPYDCPIELLPGAPIPFGHIYPLAGPELKALKDYIEENRDKGFIRPSSSPAGAPIFFVKKKDGSLRPCIDYRELNKITIKNRYPLPLIPELLERVRHAKIFTKLDLRGAYNLVRIRSGDEWKTAFRSRYGHYEYLVMPFGLCNAPATFQHLINDIFRDLLDQFVVIYLDDILIFSNSMEEHQRHVILILERLRKNRLYIKIEKCEFHQIEIQFLGYVISPNGLQMDSSKIKAIVDWPTPRSIKDVQRFIGFANFYRRFIKNFSEIITPITQLTKKKNAFVWSPQAQESFCLLKSKFTTAPVLVHPDPELAFIVEVDASDNAIGAILSQRTGDKGLLHPCAFFSQRLSPAEKNYDVGNKELLAIISAFKEWRHHLQGASQPIIVLTDHRNLEFVRSAKCLSPRQARWSLFLNQFNFVISYRPGSRNGKADALSRIFSNESTSTIPLKTIVPESKVVGVIHNKDLLEEIKEAYVTDSLLSRPPDDVHLVLKNKVWTHGQQLYIPETIRLKILKLVHDSKIAGHKGVQKTQEFLSRFFWWPNYQRDVKKYVMSCDICARCKTPRASPMGLLQPLSVPSRPWGSISMDFIVDLPTSKGKNTILVVVDRLTKAAHFIPCTGLPSAKDTADLVVQNVFRFHGVPDEVISDRGVQFTSKFWRSFCTSLEIDINLSTAFHPQSNGQTERTNQTLEQYLRCYICHLQDDWVDLLPVAEFSYNNSQNASTKQTPFFANLGYHPNILPKFPAVSPIPAVAERISALQQNLELLKGTLERAQENYKKAADKFRRPAPMFKIGDKVWLSTRNLKLKVPSPKLGQKFLGPYKIIGIISPVAVRLKLPRSMKIHPVFHVSLLKSAVPNPFPGRILPPPDAVEIDGQEQFVIEKILDSRIFRNRLQYLIKWQGYGSEENSWEPVNNINAPRLIRQFHQRYPERPSQVSSRGRS